jgi:hypothetical protein
VACVLEVLVSNLDLDTVVLTEVSRGFHDFWENVGMVLRHHRFFPKILSNLLFVNHFVNRRYAV